MKSKVPVLIIIPHGGIIVPDELSGYEQIDRFGLFIESDCCANDLFGFDTIDSIKKIDSQISHMFVDLDRPPQAIPPKTDDGVIKKESLSGRKIFKDRVFPDEIAISNILKRYYFPFHNTIEKIIETGDIKMIFECHTMMPVGPRNSFDPGKPRSLINAVNIASTDDSSIHTCTDDLVKEFLTIVNRAFNSEEATVAGKTAYNKPKFEGYILDKYGPCGIPFIRLSVSKSLFLNDKYFSYEYMKVDELRINELKNKIWSGIDKFLSKFF